MRGAVAAIAVNTVRDAVRNRVLYILVFFSLVMIGTSVALGLKFLALCRLGAMVKVDDVEHRRV